MSILQDKEDLLQKNVLRSQGIDPESEPLSSDESVDDEETIRAADIEDTRDLFEGQKLAEEAAVGIEEILRAQGIDPDVRRADQTIT
ncbi:hypothetical protein FGB62_201g011 [Gracilaria domingensis]|nr:hypothetical protein FGB62_201g011 [Gracilaria domingensis]